MTARTPSNRDQAQPRGPRAIPRNTPLLNPLEMNNGDAKTLVAKVAAADYAPLIRRAFGADVFADPERAFDAIATSLAAFQSSAPFAPFTSKFDAVVRGQAKSPNRKSAASAFSPSARRATAPSAIR